MKNFYKMVVTLSIVALSPIFVRAEERDIVGMSLEQLLNIDVNPQTAKGISMYGYMNTNVEKVFNSVGTDANGKTVKADDPMEWSNPYFRLFLRASLSNSIDTFANIAAWPDANGPLEVRNMWGNFKLADLFQLRFGKIYKKFDLYNEKLDEVPTYFGIEPPELFDKDHLMLPRLTTFMIHGDKNIGGESIVSYSVSTDNGENGPAKAITPIGWDLRADLHEMRTMIGISGYSSSVRSGRPTASTALGTGSPDESGILPWIESDKYNVVGAFVEKQVNNLLIKTAYYTAKHDAKRDPTSVVTLVKNAGISAKQRERFLGDSASVDNAVLSPDDVVVDAPYIIKTSYVQLGYYFYTKHGTVAPYLYYDWYSNPETIAKKKYGGDNEAGLADDGKFVKWTLGLNYMPLETVAIKFDNSLHVQKVNGLQETYPETRLDVSFMFK